MHAIDNEETNIETSEEAQCSCDCESSDKEDAASDIIKNHMYGAIGVGLMPLPLVDMVALTGIQINMLRRLADHYDVEFRHDIGKTLLASLVGGVTPVCLTPSLASFIKAVPLVGQTVGALSLSIFAGGSTYAVGKVFVQHFAAGGTFLDFNPASVREFFKEEFAKGKEVAGDMKPQEQ